MGMPIDQKDNKMLGSNKDNFILNFTLSFLYFHPIGKYYYLMKG